ncbi:MAG: hypothetical protein JXA87_03390 [Thermoleophilia bacterium]|nr:hypothetical protein [Thermoleophilia bacterium]
MEQTPGTENGFSDAVAAEQAGTRADPETGAAVSEMGAPRSKRGVFLLLAGLVVAGIAAGYNWARGLPKD